MVTSYGIHCGEMINFHTCFVCCHLCLSFIVLYSSDCFGYFLFRSLLLIFCRDVVVLFLFLLLAVHVKLVLSSILCSSCVVSIV